jgi:hypothetical protein
MFVSNLWRLWSSVIATRYPAANLALGVEASVIDIEPLV